MARLMKFLRQVLGSGQSSASAVPVPRFGCSIDTDFSIFREGDQVIINNAKGRDPLLTKPLQRGQKSDVRRGQLEHDKIIGRRVRSLVQARKGPEYRITHPSLEEYVALTPRLVTPIYGHDANLITSLLDIHVLPPGEADDGRPPLEILESGTGHGSLTLQLCRAIQAANSLPPPIPKASQVKYLQGRPIRPDPSKQAKPDAKPAVEEVDNTQQDWDAWRAQRKAIIHTVDVAPQFSRHAESIVRGFRRGIYAGNVDFYVGHVENWIAEQIRLRTPLPSSNLFSLKKQEKLEPFLTHAILDMPSANLRIPHVAPILKQNGLLAVFMPSVTQIGECVETIRKERLPLVLEKAVELGSGISNGRLWDIRFAVKKSRADPSSWVDPSESGAETETENDAAVSEEEPTIDEEKIAVKGTQEPAKPESVLVCRPKVGTKIVGGGFVGIWRRIEDSEREPLQ
ncbi:S-adenosyl-L-methionine-dependent methyltransferase [Aspergillus granulosus]|uniref:tRNA (adenine(58)-N(1))-methyltransferase catalytic subunit TRM61 n=1 Tax=Aspergillus granulosus TaxID=176169 RepID=A0ABR4GYW1_9EURO